ncbi:MAG: HEAT repeat domain-containing protein [Deltaproteobacteria bacterium]|nr:HEAT repeat domain-containing protein [Deltaproteobacteria bacterium]
MELRSLRACACALALLLALACERAERKGPDEAVTQPSAPTASEALGPGEARVDVDEGGVTIECQAAARGLLLEKLAREGRFELVGDLDARPLTLELRGQPIETVIAALLEDLPYRAQWRFDAKTDRHELARLEVGEIRAAGATAAATGESAAEKAKRRELADTLRQQIRERREQDRGSEEQKAELAARREERARSQADLLEQLRSSNPEMRIEAIEGLDPEGPALAALLEVLRSDPDARVREKAAEQGGEADGFLACAGLLDALGDREPAVVLRALASLEFTCDETVLPIVQKHCDPATDPAVQARCAEAIDFLQ